MTYQPISNLSSAHIATDKIKVVLVDDSNIVRTIFERVLQSTGFVEIVGCAQSASEALDLLDRVKADVVLLDIEMPNRTGLDALPDIIDRADGGKVVIVSSFVDSNGPAAIDALSRGACDTLSKPGKNALQGGFSKQLVDMVVRLSGKSQSQTNDIVSSSIMLPVIQPPKAIFIGASTGGIPSIEEFLKHLSHDVDVPIFIAQHLPDAFISYFARQLLVMSKRQIVPVYEKSEIKAGHIYLAPGDGHMVIEKSPRNLFVNKIEEYPDSFYKPSVDALFDSAADAYGSDALAILLSGMGHDGRDGARVLAEHNANIWAQNEESCVVWGMPGSVIKDKTSTTQLRPEDMSRAINRVFSS